MAKSIKKITADVKWMTLETAMGNWKNPTTLLSAAEQSQGKMTIIKPNIPEIVVTISIFDITAISY